MRFVVLPHWPRWLMSIPMAAISEGMFARMWVTLVGGNIWGICWFAGCFFFVGDVCGLLEKRASSWTSKTWLFVIWNLMDTLNVTNFTFCPIRGSNGSKPTGPKPRRQNMFSKGDPCFCGVKSIPEESTSFTYSLWPCFVCSHSLLQIPLIAPWQQKLKAWTIMWSTQRTNMKHLPGIFRVNCDTPNSLASLMQKTVWSLLGDGVITESWAWPASFSWQFSRQIHFGTLELSWHCHVFISVRPVIFTVDMAEKPWRPVLSISSLRHVPGCQSSMHCQ